MAGNGRILLGSDLRHFLSKNSENLSVVRSGLICVPADKCYVYKISGLCTMSKIPNTGSGGLFKSYLQTAARKNQANPTNGSWWIVQILSTRLWPFWSIRAKRAGGLFAGVLLIGSSRAAREETRGDGCVCREDLKHLHTARVEDFFTASAVCESFNGNNILETPSALAAWSLTFNLDRAT